jgi:hypothetical protein
MREFHPPASRDRDLQEADPPDARSSIEACDFITAGTYAVPMGLTGEFEEKEE